MLNVLTATSYFSKEPWCCLVKNADELFSMKRVYILS